MKNRGTHSRSKPGNAHADTRLLVRGARQLLTLHHRSGIRRGRDLGELGLIADGSVLIRNGVIEHVGPTRSIENLASARNVQEIDAAGRVVMPAFIDPHACLVPVPSHRTGSNRRVEAVPATRLEAQADALLKVMTRHGTATIGALSGQGNDTSGELKILRTLQGRDRKPVDIVSILFITDTLPDDGGTARELLETVARRRLARIAAVRSGTANGDLGVPWQAARPLMETARSLGMGVRLELLAEREFEVLEGAVKMQALTVSAPGPYRASEVEILADSSVIAIVLPQLLAQTGQAVFARELIDRGAGIALASGLSPEHHSTGSMQTVIQLACEHCGMSLAEAISAATANAAWALGIGSQTGTLEHGKQADLMLLNASDYREIPLLAGTNLTHSIIKRGVVLFHENFPGWPANW